MIRSARLGVRALGLGLSVAGCVGLDTGRSSAPELAPSEPAALAAVLEGAYRNQAQWDAAGPDLRRPPAAGYPYDWVDLQQAAFYRVEAPLLGGEALYLEWRAGGPGGRISRQRIWLLSADEDGLASLAFFTFKAPEPYAGRGDQPGAFAGLSLDDLIGYGPACALPIASWPDGAWTAETVGDSCAITAQSGRRMTIHASIGVTAEQVVYSEAGVMDGGVYAFKVPGVDAYLFDRLP